MPLCFFCIETLMLQTEPSHRVVAWTLYGGCRLERQCRCSAWLFATDWLETRNGCRVNDTLAVCCTSHRHTRLCYWPQNQSLATAQCTCSYVTVSLSRGVSWITYCSSFMVMRQVVQLHNTMADGVSRNDTKVCFLFRRNRAIFESLYLVFLLSAYNFIHDCICAFSALSASVTFLF